MNNVLIIFGATGDLMDKKMSPSLYSLFQQKPDLIDEIIGFGRKPYSNSEFRDSVKQSVQKKMEIDVGIESFLNKITYHKGEFHELDSFKNLYSTLSTKYLQLNKFVYFAVPPGLYPLLIENLHKSGLLDKNTRLMVEKPIGNDYASAKLTEEMFSKYLSEDQIYRIDHYLGKDAVQNILSFRFANSIFDPIWNKDFVEKIEIIAHETLGVENRGAFYDSVGALKDFGQNHILQLLALLTMDEPEQLCCQSIRDKRSELLSKLKVYSEDEVKVNTFRAQYSGYKQIKNVNEDSSTETYFKIRAFIDSDRWKGVPIYLESGKRMSKVKKELIIHFKGVNKITFSIEPEDTIKIKVKTKKSGLTYENEDNEIILSMIETKSLAQYVAGYMELIFKFINEDQTFFLCKEESLRMWEFVQPIIDFWTKDTSDLETYTPDTNEAVEKANNYLND